MSKVIIIGIGEVGGHVLQYLVRDPKCPELICCDSNEGRELKVNNALIGAAVMRLYPTVRFQKLDMTDINATAKLIKEENPDVIINCSVLQTWHVIRQLPEEQYKKLSSANLGAWLPCQVALPYKLMQAVKKSGVKTHVINTALSCITNAALAKIGLAPTIGIGNVELIEPAVRLFVSRKLNVPIDCVKVYLVCHHAWWVYPREAGYIKTPYFIKIMVNDREVTKQFDTDRLMWDSIRLYPPGTEFTTVSASSTIKNMYAFLNPSPVFTHSPGPNGLPGGYPIIISSKGVELALPEGITQSEAVKINEEAQRTGDSIERIEEDGTCVWAEYAHKILKEMLGFERTSFKLEESYEVALDMMERYKKFAARICGASHAGY